MSSPKALWLPPLGHLLLLRTVDVKVSTSSAITTPAGDPTLSVCVKTSPSWRVTVISLAGMISWRSSKILKDMNMISLWHNRSKMNLLVHGGMQECRMGNMGARWLQHIPHSMKMLKRGDFTGLGPSGHHRNKVLQFCRLPKKCIYIWSLRNVHCCLEDAR